MPRVRHREVWVDLTGKRDRLTIIGTVAHAMRQRAIPEETVEEFREEAHRKTRGIKDLLELCGRWVEVTNNDEEGQGGKSGS